MSSWDGFIEEYFHDGNLIFDWVFSKIRVINGYVIIDSDKKEIRH